MHKNPPRTPKGTRWGGRQKGTQNKVTIAAREFALSIVEDESYRLGLQERALSGKLHPSIEVMLWHYAHGKPKETHEVTGVDGKPIMQRILVEFKKAGNDEPA